MQPGDVARSSRHLLRLILVAGLALGVLICASFIHKAGNRCTESGNLVVLDGFCTPRI